MTAERQVGPDSPLPPKKRGVRLPWIVLGLGILGTALLWIWPSDALEGVYRVIGTYVLAFVTHVALVLWFLVLSPFRWPIRWLPLMLTVVLVAVCWRMFRIERSSGDLWPIVFFRWTPTADERVEQHRPLGQLPVLTDNLGGHLPGDYPEYRGRKRDGIVLGPELNQDWDTQPPRLLWKQPVGRGYSSFAIAGNLAVTLEQRRDDEAVVGYDTATGRERWIFRYPALFNEKMGGKGPRSTPTISDGEVFALGATGKLHCLDARTGRPKWDVDVLAGNSNVQWGMSGSPLVFDDLVVVNPGVQATGAPGGTLMAYDRASGTLRWTAGRAHAGYSSPMLATLAGRRQIVLFDGEGVSGYDPADKGKELWRYPWKETQENINVAQPLVLENDRIFITSGYGVGCAMLQIKNDKDQWTVETLWRNRAMRCKFTSPVAYQDHLYGLDDGVLVCLEAASGKRKWRDGRYHHGQLLLTHGLLVILSEYGELVLVPANPDGHRELGRFAALQGNTWNLPALSAGRVFVRNDRDMASYDLR